MQADQDMHKLKHLKSRHKQRNKSRRTPSLESLPAASPVDVKVNQKVAWLVAMHLDWYMICRRPLLARPSEDYGRAPPKVKQLLFHSRLSLMGWTYIGAAKKLYPHKKAASLLGQSRKAPLGFWTVPDAPSCSGAV